MKTTYTALTIGPIIDALLTARKTRELWASSYLFSYIMREISKALHKNDFEVLLPSVDNINDPNPFGAGLYPDRIIFKNNPEAKEDSPTVIKSVFDEVYKKIHTVLKELDGAFLPDAKGVPSKFSNPFTLPDVTKYLQSYIKFYGVQTELDPKTDNIVFNLSSFLETKELQNRLLPIESPVVEDKTNIFHDWSPLRIFLHRINGTFLFKDGFDITARLKAGEPASKTRFDSLPEIATRELNFYDSIAYNGIVEGNLKQTGTTKQQDTSEDTLIAELSKNFKDNFKARHKYVAIVHADGDSISKVINNLTKALTDSKQDNQEQRLKDFSSVMLQFARKATEIVINYGGAPVYMGGDDMLFFAPVSNRLSVDEPKLIFDLIKELDKEFLDYFKEYIAEIQSINNKRKAEGKEEIPTPTLSYGLSITYYKYPLYEARNLSFGLLDHVKNNVPKKNAINVQLQKHSGQGVPFILKKSNKAIYQQATSIIKTAVKNPLFLNSFTYKLETQGVLLKQIANDEHRLEHFFKNYFNEDYKQNQSFFEEIISLIMLLSDQKPVEQMVRLNKEDLELIHGILRFVHFIRS